jgi:hypothetical protein
MVVGLLMVKVLIIIHRRNCLGLCPGSKLQCCGSGLDPDSMGPLIRILICIRNPDPDPGGKKPTNIEKVYKFHFFGVLDVLF